MPTIRIEQVMIANNRAVSDPQFELDLYVIRRRIEKQAALEGIKDFYICSLSCRSVSLALVPYKLPNTSAHSRNSPPSTMRSKRSRLIKL